MDLLLRISSCPESRYSVQVHSEGTNYAPAVHPSLFSVFRLPTPKIYEMSARNCRNCQNGGSHTFFLLSAINGPNIQLFLWKMICSMQISQFSIEKLILPVDTPDAHIFLDVLLNLGCQVRFTSNCFLIRSHYLYPDNFVDTL